MSLKRWDARRDAGEKAIRQALEAAGCIVWQLDQPADLLVGLGNRLFLIECKEKRGRLTAAQQKAKEQGWPIMVCRTPLQALSAVGLLAQA